MQTMRTCEECGGELNWNITHGAQSAHEEKFLEFQFRAVETETEEKKRRHEQCGKTNSVDRIQK